MLPYEEHIDGKKNLTFPLSGLFLLSTVETKAKSVCRADTKAVKGFYWHLGKLPSLLSVDGT